MQSQSYNNPLSLFGKNRFYLGDYEGAMNVFVSLCGTNAEASGDIGWCALSLLASGRYEQAAVICKSQLDVSQSTGQEDWLVFWRLFDVFLKVYQKLPSDANDAMKAYLAVGNLVATTDTTINFEKDDA